MQVSSSPVLIIIGGILVFVVAFMRFPTPPRPLPDINPDSGAPHWTVYLLQLLREGLRRMGGAGSGSEATVPEASSGTRGDR